MRFDILKKAKRAAFFITALSLCTAAALFGGSPSVVNAGTVAEVHAAAADTTAVNLKEGEWVYSTHLDKNNEVYASVTGYNGTTLSLEIPSTLGGYEVRSISREAFVGNKYLTDVTLSEGITDIGKYCFQGCIGLNRVSLPSTLKGIGEGAFYGCYSLSEIEIPDNVTKIGSYAFYNCRHIKNAKLSASLKSLGDSAFGKCAMLETVTFGEDLESVGSAAFHGCTALTSVTFPSGVISLGSGAFVNCKSLTEADLGVSLEEIRSETFRGCESLENVSFGGAVREIGTSAFEDCTALKSMEFGEGVNYIGALAFYRCTGLQSLSLGGVYEIGIGAFNGCTSLKAIRVAASNETFQADGSVLYDKGSGKLVFCAQGATGKVKISENTTEIDEYAFNGCQKLTGVSFPESVSKIGTGAFLSCTHMTAISVPAEIEKLGCLSLGYYFDSGELKKASYLSMYGGAESAAALYCSAHEVSFKPYSDTLLLNTEHAVIAEGDSFEVTYTFLSDKKAKLTWESSDPSVVTAEDGKLKAIAAGSAEVTVTADDISSRVVKVTVVKPSENISNTKKSYDSRRIYRGETEELSSILEQIIDPLLDVNKFWYSSDPKVAVVSDDGRITAIGAGSANITCRLPDGSENYFWITVTERPLRFSVIQPSDEIPLGESITLKKEILPTKSTDTVTWKSDNSNIALVDAKGVVTAVSQGSCDITATTASGIKSTVTVKCVIPADSISLDVETRSVYQSKEFNLTAQLSPADSRQRIVWRSSDPSVVSVNSKGKVTGSSFGTATVYAATASGAETSCVVNVVAKAEQLSLDVKNLALNIGDDRQLHAVIFPSYSPETTDKCTWNSTDEKIATVDENGVVRAVGVGSCIINCKTSGDLISKCRVQVKQPAQIAEITSDVDNIYIGQTAQLKLKLIPENTTDNVEWSCEDDSIARVTSQGVVKGRAAGTVMITAKAVNEINGETVTAAYELTVLKKAESVKLKRTSISMNVGDTDSLLYVITPSDSNDTVTWSSSDESIATVREDGLITAVKSGTCYISVKTGSGCSARCKIIVN